MENNKLNPRKLNLEREPELTFFGWFCHEKKEMHFYELC